MELQTWEDVWTKVERLPKLSAKSRAKFNRILTAAENKNDRSFWRWLNFKDDDVVIATIELEVETMDKAGPSANDMEEALRRVLREETGHKPAKRSRSGQTDTDTCEVSVMDADAQTVWNDKVVAAKGKKLNLEGLVKMRTKRLEQNAPHDTELPYHSHILAIMEAASGGQVGISFAKEDHSAGDKAREDIRGCVNGGPVHPFEAKAVDVRVPVPGTGMHRNAGAYGKMLKAIYAKYLDAPVDTYLGCFWERIQYMWPCKIIFRRQGNEKVLERCMVAPPFPAPGIRSEGNEVCLNLANLSSLSPTATLTDLLTATSAYPPKGFYLAVRCVDAMAQLHMFPLAPLRLECLNGTFLDLSQAYVVAYGRRSLVLRLSFTDAGIIKVSSAANIDREVHVHIKVDGRLCRSLRRMTTSVRGTVHGAGDSLKFMRLERWCRPVTAADFNSPAKLAQHWQAAANALDTACEEGLLLRDIKPDNLLMDEETETLVVNDYDVACFKSDELSVRKQRAGNEEFRSPLFEPGRAYDHRDVYLAMALTFAYLAGVEIPDTAAGKRRRLGEVRDNLHFPAGMRDAIRKYL